MDSKTAEHIKGLCTIYLTKYLINKFHITHEEAYKKFKEHVKKAAPNMLLGTVGGILAGPFGLLGNAALGASVGLLSSTEGFHKFIFGDPEEGKGGVLDAFKTGFSCKG